MSRRALLAALAVLACAPAYAKAYRRPVEIGDLPLWVREAAQAPQSPTDATLIVLHDELIATPLPAGGVRMVRRWAGRPLKQPTLDEVSDYSLPYESFDRDVRLRGWTVAPDGNSACAPDPVLDVRDDPYTSDGATFDDVRVRWLRTASPAVGSLVAFEGSWVDGLDSGAVAQRFGTELWPVRLARLVLELPAGWSGAHAAFGLREVPCAETEGSIVCEARDIPPLPRDELRPPVHEALATVWARWWNAEGTRGFQDWNAVGRWDHALSEPVLADAGDAPAIAERLKPSGPEDLPAAIERAFVFAAREVRYVAIQLGIGGWRPNPPAKVLARRYGDCKDKSFVLRAILERWGLKTYFVAVLTRDEGVVRPEVPTFGQFNHMIAAVALPEGFSPLPWSTVEIEGLGRLLLLDATSRDAGPWALREDDQGTLGLVVHPGGGRLVRLPLQPPAFHRNERVLRAEVDDTGSLVTASLSEVARENAGAVLRSWAGTLGEEERRRRHVEWLQRRFPGSRVADYAIEGLDRTDVAVVETSRLEGGWFGKRVAHMLLVEPGRAARGLFSRPLPPPSGHGFRAGAPREESVEAVVAIPAGWVPEKLPVPLAIEAKGMRVQASWSLDDGALVYRRTVSLDTNEVSRSDYPGFRDAFRRADAADATAIVFVKSKP